jgi:hypothetical protein
MTKLFHHGDRHMPMRHVYNMLLLISEGMTGVDDEMDNQIRKYAVLYYIDFLEKHTSGKPIPASLERVIAWILGEYRYGTHSLFPFEMIIFLFIFSI